MIIANPVVNAPDATFPSSNRTMMTLSITQRIAKLDATVASAKTAAPLNAIANGRGWSDSIERISCQFRRARELLDSLRLSPTGVTVVFVTSGTSRFYQPYSAITCSTVVTHGDQFDINGHFQRKPRKKGITVGKVLFLIGAILFVSFWGWALLFASKTAVNKIEDRAWAERAEGICAPVKEELRAFEMQADPSLIVRASLVVKSTDTLGRMLDNLTAVTPSDAKGQAIVPAWIADWRQLLDDRYAYSERLLDGQNVAFTETAVSGVPITERIENFARENEMPSCAPPHGSVI
jgi:hypothetical protein